MSTTFLNFFKNFFNLCFLPRKLLVEYFIKTGKKVDSLLIKNDITEDYINYVKQMPKEYYSAMKLGYGIDVHNNIYTTVRETGKDTDTEMYNVYYRNIVAERVFLSYALVNLYGEALGQDINKYCQFFIEDVTLCEMGFAKQIAEMENIIKGGY